MLVHLLTVAIDGIDSGGVRDIPSILVFMHVASTIYRMTPEREKEYLRVRTFEFPFLLIVSCFADFVDRLDSRTWRFGRILTCGVHTSGVSY